MWDAIVIGAGIEGSATAYSLAKNGQKTLVIEQFFLPHSRGSSHGHSRITRKAYPEDFYSRMMVDGFDLWKKLEQEEQVQLYIKTGLLTVSQTGSNVLDETANSLRLVNSKFERLDPPTMKRRYQTLSFDASDSAILDHDGGMLLADKCLRAFQNQFKKNGGVIRDGEAVIKVVPVSDKLVRVVTAQGEYSAKSVVITAGPWANKVLQTVGLQLPLQPQRVNVWYWKQLEGGYGAREGFPTFIYVDGHDEIYGLPSHEYPGLVKVAFHGGQNVENPDQRDLPRTEERFIRYAMNFVSRHLPGLEARPSITETCMYTVTPDTNFILDHHPKHKNIVIGAGFSGHGFKFAPVVGKVLAELATGKAPSHNLQPFRISRFTDSKSKL